MTAGTECDVISVWVEKAGADWFGVAHHGGRLVATAIGGNRKAAAAAVRACLPRDREFQAVRVGSEFARSVVRLLARLEGGDEEAPFFELCPDCVGEPLASVLRAASTIPRGYVATYGGIAEVAGTEARVVGRVMSTNPLYPIVPCHRVVGSDMSLVGYSGRQDVEALRAKLERLRAEARGYVKEKVIGAAGGAAAGGAAGGATGGLRVYPVERVIAKTAREGLDPGVQLSLW
jgi:methylated-DNA-[protein]-cysteine S-methyltransferase